MSSGGCAPIPAIVVASIDAPRCREMVHESGKGLQELGGLNLYTGTASDQTYKK